MRALAWSLVLVACSGSKSRVAEDAVSPSRGSDAAGPVTVPIDATAPVETGDLVVRVEWKDVPVVARASPGRTRCNTPSAASVAPTTTWGIPDVFVIVDGMPAKPRDARIVFAECALVPRVAAGSTVILESAHDRPEKVGFGKRGTVADPTKLIAWEPRQIQLPIAGHSVTVPVEPNTIYQLMFFSELAWAVTGPAVVTDASGAATIEGLAVGTHKVTAWLPPRGSQPARIGKGEITIKADAQAELTIDLQ